MKAQAVATHSGANAASLLFLAAYLAIVLYQGNLSKLADQARTDFLGGNGKPAFWRWAIALLLLYALARNPSTNSLFGPILVLVLVAMLIEMATTQPGTFATLNKQIAGFFGRDTSTQNPASPGFSVSAASGAG